MQNPEDNELIQLLKSESEKGFNKIYEKYYHYVYQTMFYRFRNEEEARDTTQEVFINLWKDKDSIVVKKTLRAYLYKCARNRMINKLKKKKRTEVHHKIFTDQSIIKQDLMDDDSKERYNKVLKVLKSLPKNQQEYFKSVHLDGKKAKEVADENGVSVNTVRSTINTVMAKLRSIFKPK